MTEHNATHYNLSNLSQTDLTSSLPLPRYEVPDAAISVPALEGPPNPATVRQMLTLLNDVDVSYLRTSKQLPQNVPQGSGGFVGELQRLSPDVFDVNIQVDPPKPVHSLTFDIQSAAAKKNAAGGSSRASAVGAGNVGGHRQYVPQGVAEAAATASREDCVAAFESWLESTFESTDVIADNANGEFLSIDQLRQLNNSIEHLSAQGFLPSVQVDSLGRLQRLLEKHVKAGQTVEVTEADMESSESFLTVMLSVDASLALLNIMTAPNIPKKVHREESIELVVELIRYQTSHNIFPGFDGMYAQMYRGGAADDEGDMTGTKSSGKSGKKRRKSSNAANGQYIKALRILLGKIAQVYSKVAVLLEVLQLQDSVVLQLTNTTMSTLAVEDIQVLQLASLEVISMIFKYYDEHRGMVLDELLNTFLKLPTSKRNLRTFVLVDEDEKCVQMCSALLLECIQGCVVAPAAAIEGNSDSAHSSPGDQYKIGLRWTKYFWSELMKKQASARLQEIKFTTILENLVADVLTMLHLPEWPSAHMLVQGLYIEMIGASGLQSTNSSLRAIAMDLLGKALAQFNVQARKSQSMADKWVEAVAATRISPNGYPPSTIFPHLSDQDRTNTQGVLALASRQLKQVTASIHGDAASAAVGMEGGNASGDQSVALLRQVLMGYMTGMHQRHSDHVALSAQHFFVCQWAHLDKVAAEVDAPEAAANQGFYQKQREEALKLHHANEHLSREMAVSLCCYLHYSRTQTLKESEVLLKRLLVGSDDPGPGTRERAIKALCTIVESEPQILGNIHVQSAVERRLSDSNISVRRAAVDLLGKFISTQPQYANAYYSSIVERITDVGVSVRKSVVTILRDCVQVPGFEHTSEALVKIMLRILDTESSIQDAVCRTFIDMWLSVSVDQMEARMQMVVDVIWKVYESRRQQAPGGLLPLNSSFPAVALFTRILGMEEPPLASAAQQLTMQLLVGILEAKDGSSSERRPLQYAVSLHTMCAADVSTCIPQDNPLRFVRTLQPYLELSPTSSKDAKVDEASKVQCMLAVINAVLTERTKQQGSTSMPSTLATLLKDNLEEILLRNHYHGVLLLSASCLCSLASADEEAKTAVLRLTKKFYEILLGYFPRMAEKNNAVMGWVLRGLFILGHLARYGCQFIDESPQRLANGIELNIEAVLSIFLKYYNSNLEIQVKVGALQATGFLLISRPQLLFAGTNVDALMNGALDNSKESPYIKEQLITNLIELVKAEEGSIVAGQQEQLAEQVGAAPATSKKDNERVVPASVVGGENCMSGGIVQQYWEQLLDHATHSSPKVRVKVLQLAEVVLRHGLIHPMSCIPQFLALHGDPSMHIRRLAARLLAQINEKYPTFIMDRLPDGIRLVYEIQKATASTAGQNTAQAEPVKIGASKESIEGVGGIYTLLRTQRNVHKRFLDTLLRRCEDTEITREALPYMCFNAHLLASLPYNLLEEPLYVVHNVNRIISIRGATLESQLKANLKATSTSKQDDLQSPGGMPVGQSSDTPLAERTDAPGGPGEEMDHDADDATPPTQQLQDDCNASISLSILLLLKRHLRVLYGLTDARIQAFIPTEQRNVNELANPLQTDLPMPFTEVDLDCCTMRRSVKGQYHIFKKLMKEDSNDFNPEYTAAKPAGRRGRPPGSGAGGGGSGGAAASTKKRKGRGSSGKKGKGRGDEESDEDDQGQDYHSPQAHTAKRLAPLY